MRGHHAIRHDALGVELDAHAHAVERRFAVRVVVGLEAELRALLEDLGGAIGEDVGVVAGAVLDQIQRVADVRAHAEIQAAGIDAFGMIHIHMRVMHGAVRVRDDLHPFHITVFSQARVDMFFGNEVGAVGRNLEALRHANDQVGLAVSPLAV